MIGSGRCIVGPALLLVLAAPAALGGQSPDEPEGYLGVGFVVAQPTGAFGRTVDQGFGAELKGRFHLDPDGWVSLRADVGFIIYGHERLNFCSALSCRVGLDLTTTNSILFAGMGPEVSIPGEWMRPYAYGTFGIGYFNTVSRLSGDHDYDAFASTVNFDDAVFQTRVGGGLEVRVRGGPKPIHLDFGVDYHANGIAEYLREGDIVDHPDGSITLLPRRSEANLVTFRMGVSFGVGGGDHHGGRGDRW